MCITTQLVDSRAPSLPSNSQTTNAAATATNAVPEPRGRQRQCSSEAVIATPTMPQSNHCVLSGRDHSSCGNFGQPCSSTNAKPRPSASASGHSRLPPALTNASATSAGGATPFNTKTRSTRYLFGFVNSSEIKIVTSSPSAFFASP